MHETDGVDNAATASARAGYQTRQSSAAAGVAASMANARASLQASLPTLQADNNRFGTAPEIVGNGVSGAFLTAASPAAHEATLRGFLNQNAALYGLSAAEAAALEKIADYTNPDGNLSWVGLKQTINGPPIFQAELQAAFTRDGALVRTSSNLVPALDALGLAITPVLPPGVNLDRAGSHLQRHWQHHHAGLRAGGPGWPDATLLPHPGGPAVEL